MIFWILTVLIFGGWLYWVVYWFVDDGIWLASLAFIGGGILTFMVWLFIPVLFVSQGIQSTTSVTRVERIEEPLRAIGSDSSIEGRFYFLGGGYVDGKRVLSYIRGNEDGSFTPDQVDGSESKVFEGAEEPKMVTVREIKSHWWLAPEDLAHVTKSYEFHVPEGTVSEGYSVAP